MSTFNTYQLSNICTRLSSGKSIHSSSVSETGPYPVIGGNGRRGYSQESNFAGECAIVGRQGAACGNVRYFSGEAYMTEHAVVIQTDRNHNTRYLAYFLSTMNLGRLSAQSAQPGLSVKTLSKQEVVLPNKNTQDKTVTLLGAIDDAIESNSRLNDYLAETVDALFKHEVLEAIDDSWSRASLLDIANYKNGLAMQKFRPEGEDPGLPVLKIKELGQGRCAEDADRCRSDIDESVQVHDGDLIFSWSGTLLLDFWAGGHAGLNQHLFKVTSKKYEPWFYFLWTNYHMRKFIALAKDRATTMGHIKRSALAESEVYIPSESRMLELGRLFDPLIEEIISSKTESRKLSELRDTLLPKLMSGEINVSKIELGG